MDENDGFLDLGRRRYLKLRPERLEGSYFAGEPVELGNPESSRSPQSFHAIYFEAGGRMLDFKEYQTRLVMGDPKAQAG
jgi:hypothetical protein